MSTKKTDAGRPAGKPPWSDELEAVDQKKRVEVEEAILVARGNIMRAARALGVKRPTLHRWLEEYGLATAAADLRREAGQGKGRPPNP